MSHCSKNKNQQRNLPTATQVEKKKRTKREEMKNNDDKGKQRSQPIVINSDSPEQKTPKKDTKRITIVGDSMLNGIMEDGMQKNHNVRIKRRPGATTLDIMDHVKPVIRKKSDLNIIHTGTNDLTCKEEVDTVKTLSSVIEEERRVSSETKIALSGIVVRKDKQAMQKKVVMPWFHPTQRNQIQ